MLVLLTVAGCGGGEEPGLPSDLAERLAVRSESIASEIQSGEFCDARAHAVALQQQAIRAINSGQVPAELQEELLGSANTLVTGISCTRPEASDSAVEDARAFASWLRERSG